MSATRGCLGKVGYETRAEADRAKKHLHAKPGYVKCGAGRPDALSTYHCRCGLFHLGRDPRAGGKDHRRTADHHAGSFKRRLARYLQLTEQGE